MKLFSLFFLIILLSTSFVHCQYKTIKGKILDDYFLKGYPEVQIHDQDTTLLGITNELGAFSIELESSKDTLIFSRIGLEWTTIKLNEGCDHVELIVFEDANYDYRSIRKENKVRKKRFNKLPELYRKAFDKETFRAIVPCFERNFVYH